MLWFTTLCHNAHSIFKALLRSRCYTVGHKEQGGIRNDRDDNSTQAFRKARYRQYVLDIYGYLGKGNRKVCPSCVVTVIWRHYPSHTGVYMGYRAV